MDASFSTHHTMVEIHLKINKLYHGRNWLCLRDEFGLFVGAKPLLLETIFFFVRGSNDCSYNLINIVILQYNDNSQVYYAIITSCTDPHIFYFPCKRMMCSLQN